MDPEWLHKNPIRLQKKSYFHTHPLFYKISLPRDPFQVLPNPIYFFSPNSLNGNV